MKPIFLWDRFSTEIKEALKFPLQAGRLNSLEGMRLAECVVEEKSQNYQVKLALLVDEEDGIIADAKYQTNGPLLLIALLELVCRYMIRKNYLQVYRFQSDTLEALLNLQQEFFDKYLPTLINLTLEAIEETSEQFFDIPIAEDIPPPSPMGVQAEGEGLALWGTMSQSEKLQEIRKVLDQEIRPYIELDAGGIEIVSLSQDDHLKIAYQGACTSCPSSIGSTLEAINNILKAKLSPTLKVEPDESFLNLSI